MFWFLKVFGERLFCFYVCVIFIFFLEKVFATGSLYTTKAITAAEVPLLGAWGSGLLLQLRAPLFVRPLHALLLGAGHDGADE